MPVTKPIIFCSCGGNDIKEQSEIDSLRNELAQKTAELEMANDFVDLQYKPDLHATNQMAKLLRTRVTDKDFTARFYYSLDGMDFHPIGNVLKMGLGLPWTANRFCLFNFTTKENGTDGYADFNWFRFTNK